jgi:tetratricopeptide (TPR) repeat protein
MPSPCLILLLLLTGCFTLATWLAPRSWDWGGRRAEADNLMAVVLGDARRLFANHFFVKADVYFHSGYYPSIFDQAAPRNTAHLAGGHDEHDDHDERKDEHEKEMDFLGPPRDWVERFGRNFFITQHTHLARGTEREILPWLRLSAALDPQRVETYTLAAYWLRKHLGKVKEADAFLRDGLRANPDSYEVLFELGRLYDENYQDARRARNVWELAVRQWREQESNKPEPDVTAYRELVTHLARLEEREGNLREAVMYLEELKKVSPGPELIQQQIDELKQKLAGSRSVPGH